MPSGEGAGDEVGDTSLQNDKKEQTGGRRNPQQGGYQKQLVPRQPKFEGKCDDLKGYIYYCSDARQADLFAKTTKEIAEYVGRTYKYGGDIRLVVENLALPTLAVPDDPPDGASRTVQQIWEKNVDEYVKRSNYLSENVKTLYSLVWGQCTDIMRQKVEALGNFETMSSDGDGLELLRAIKDMSFNFQSQKYVPHSLHESKHRFYMCSQGRHLTTQAYLEYFQNMVDVIEHSGGSIGHKPGIERAIAAETGAVIDSMTVEQRDNLKKEAQDRYLAVAFMLGSDRSRFGRLIENLENDFLQGRNNYPASLTGAYSLLTNWKQDPRNIMRAIGPLSDGVSFAHIGKGDIGDNNAVLANSGQPRKGGGRRDKAHITCHRCGSKGIMPMNV